MAPRLTKRRPQPHLRLDEEVFFTVFCTFAALPLKRLGELRLLLKARFCPNSPLLLLAFEYRSRSRPPPLA